MGFDKIAIDDVITYLVKSIDTKSTEGKSFDLGGPDVDVVY